MRYRELGKTGLNISVVGFGGIPIQRTDAEGTKKVIDACEEKGINYIDTARGYTVSEGYLGYALEGRRDKFILATKSMARSYEAMAADIETSLTNLKTDYIDLYQLHNIKTDADFELCFSDEGAYKALTDAKAAGKIGHIGATCHSLEAFAKIVEEYSDKIETIMFPFNIIENQGVEVMERSAAKGMGFIAMKPLAGGNIEDGRLAHRYIFSNPNCHVSIPGMADVEEVYQNALAGEDESPITAEELAECEKIRTELGTSFCRRCGYCAPCPEGIDIPTNFLFVNYLRHYGLADWAKERYAGVKVKADACVKCGICETRCPYDLKIRDMLEKVAIEMA
jgi:Predicted oxidoreductases of the aldo/keto reductase family